LLPSKHLDFYPALWRGCSKDVEDMAETYLDVGKCFRQRIKLIEEWIKSRK